MPALNDGWSVRHEDLSCGIDQAGWVERKEDGWLQADLPCDVHMPLLAAGLIAEPLVAENAAACRWIEDRSWWFRKRFRLDEAFLQAEAVELTLDSLDAEADVFLNGAHLGHQRSAFYPFVGEVRKHLRAGENVLLVRVSVGLERYGDQDSSLLRRFVCTEQERGHPDRGDIRRVFLRKPQYVFGWDWAPRVATCGLAGGARLEALSRLAVRSVRAVTRAISPEAVLAFGVEVENLDPTETVDAVVTLEMALAGRPVARIEREAFLRSGLNYVDLEVRLAEPALWWPNGMGGQPLYTVKITAAAAGIVAGYPEFKYGIRTIRLDTAGLDGGGRRFALEVNGVEVFCKGANWTPADSIYPRISAEKYERLLREAREANFNMLRVWGGGFYEPDVFYEKCDEYGILLWHDFMFACGLYPDHLPWFREEVERELDYQTRRLRNHACLALWCGNNENHWAFHDWWPGEPAFFGGAECYNRIAPRVVRRNCPEIPYWNSSPYGGRSPNDGGTGNKHHWHEGFMHREMERRITPEDFDAAAARFVSEYGYIGPCHRASIARYHGGEAVARDGRIWRLHTNTFEESTVAAGIAKHYTDPERLDLDGYLLYAGLCQGLMLGYSLEAFRVKEDCGGALFWMYTDCWGETGWSIVDYYLNRKIAYYFVRRALQPVKLILRASGGRVRAIGVNDTPAEIRCEAEYGYVSFDGQDRDAARAELRLPPFSRGKVLEFAMGDHDLKRGCCFVQPAGTSAILPATLRTAPFRELAMPETKLRIGKIRPTGDGFRFAIKADRYAHAVHFGLRDEARPSDEYFDLLPGEEREIAVHDPAHQIGAEEITVKAIR